MISEEHGQFVDAEEGWTIRDNRSRNGLYVNFNRASQTHPFLLPGQATVEVSTELLLECFTVSSPLPEAVTLNDRRYRPASCPALVIIRPDNRSKLAYALMRDCLPIGGRNPAKGLVLPGMSAGRQGTLWWWQHRFWWQPREPATVADRAVGPNELMPLKVDTSWNTGSLQLSIRHLAYGLFK